MTDERKTPVQFIDVDAEFAGQRIDNFLLARLKGVPKSVIYRVVRKGEVRVNKGRIKPEYKLQAGDQVRVPPMTVAAESDPVSVKLTAVKTLESHILYEDNELIVLNKPTGMAVHGGSGLQFGAIEALRALRPQAKFLELVHRLDRDTSGCLLIAKKRSILTALHEQLRLKVVEKKYWALVAGQWDGKIKKVTEPLKKNTLQSGERIVRVDERDGKPSETRFKVLQRFAEGTLLEAFPVTGRTHQIRVHTACNGHPIACDDKYGDNEFTGQMNALGLNRLFLHAKLISFQHPVSAERMTFEAPLDKALAQILTKLVKNNNAAVTGVVMLDVKVVIFDWDGTVMDSVGKIVNSVRIAAERLTLPVPTEHAAKQIIGLSLEPAFKTLFPDSTVAERELLSEHYKDVYSNVDKTPTPLFEGAELVFSTLRQRGYQLAVATGKARRGLDRMFAETKTGHHFITSRCSDEAQSKPHPQMLQHILSELQLVPAQAVMIGDSRYDLMMAHSIEMPRIGVTHGVHGHAEFAPFNPHAVVDNLTALLDIFP